MRIETTLPGGQLQDMEDDIVLQGFTITEIPTWKDTMSNGDLVWLITCQPTKEWEGG